MTIETTDPVFSKKNVAQRTQSITAAWLSAGEEITHTEPTSQVFLKNNGSSKWDIEYKLGSADWKALGPLKSITYNGNLADTTLFVRRGENSPTSTEILLQFEGVADGLFAGDQLSEVESSVPEDNNVAPANTAFDSLRLAPLYHAPLTADLSPAAGAGGVTFGRASDAWHPGDDGIYRRYTSGVPGFNSLGMFIEPARTNYVSCHNANPDAAIGSPASLAGITVTGSDVVSRENRPASLAAAGLGLICSSGRLFRYENSTGNTQTITVACATFPAGTYRAALSMWAQVIRGSVTMRLEGPLGAVTIEPDTVLRRHVSENVGPVVGAEDLQIVVPHDAVIEFVLPQVELGPNNSTRAGVTSPIITAGASAARAQVVANLPIGANNWPSSGNELTIYCEATLLNQNQDYNNPVLLEAYKDNPNRLVINTTSANFRRADVSSTLNHRFGPQPGTSRIAMRVSASSGVDVFSDSGKGQTGAPTQTSGTGIDTGTLYLGTRSYNDQVLCGQLRNIKVYASAPDDATMQAMTAPATAPLYIPNVGPIIYDRATPARIWALTRTGGNNWTHISYSDTHGAQWTRLVTLTNPNSLNGLARDRRGNLYYATGTGLMRVDVLTLAQTLVITWAPVRPDWTWHPWTWGEDRAGNIYTAAYTLTGTGNQYVWKGAPGGTSWQRRDSLVTQFPAIQHVHSLHVNPYTNHLWVCYGDDLATRGTARSTNGLATDTFATDWTVITNAAAPGPTGISFSDEGTYLFSDNVGSQNYVEVVPAGTTTAQIAFTVPFPFQVAPIYYGRMLGRNEAWIATVNETGGANLLSAIFRLRKSDGVNSRWSVQSMLSIEDRGVTGLNYREVAHNGDGVIPATARYVYVSVANASGIVQGALRMDRNAT